MHKSLIERKKRSNINKRQEHLLHLSKIVLINFSRNVLVRKTKDNHLVPLENWNKYLKKLYASLDTMGTILNTHIKEYIFSQENIESMINKFANGKAKYIEGYHAKIFKMGRSFLIPHLHKILNLALKRGFPKPWMQIPIVPIFKNGDKSVPINYKTIMINHTLAKLYGLILEKKIRLWIENHGKRAKGQAGFRRHHSTIDHLVTLNIIAKECHNSKIDLFFFFFCAL